MHLLVVGISHHTAPIELRERIDFQGQGLEGAVRTLAARGSTREAAVVSTCNRAELYVACDDAEPARADLAAFFSEFHGIDRAALTAHVYDRVDLEAARHLFRVAAGIESMVVGESEILGQVRSAFTAATAAGTHTPALSRLFHTAIRVGRRPRRQPAPFYPLDRRASASQARRRSS